MTRAARILLAAAVLLGIHTTASGYDYIDNVPPWPDGVVRLELQLGSSPRYTDGTTPNETAIEATKAWNPYMGRVQLTYVNNSTVSKSKTNGRSNVFFDTDVYGTAFPDGALAVTLIRGSGSTPLEADVVVNSRHTWDSYRGYLRGGTFDVRRVLAHEFGHVLGLDHPDEAGQYVTALMNAHISYVDTTQQDDQDGVAARYGSGTANPPTPPIIMGHPSTVTVAEGEDVLFSVSVYGRGPFAYQWLKDGVAIAGATQDSLRLASVRIADSGRYSVRVTNEGGSVTSSEATLTVRAVTPPEFSGHPQSVSAVVGSNALFSASVSSIGPFSLQWTHDDVPIPGATGSYLSLENVSPAHAGVYKVVATNVAGSATSNPATLTVTPLLPPTRDTLANRMVPMGASVGFSSNHSSMTGTFQWYKNGVPIPGATRYAWDIASATYSDAGEYFVVVTNAAGSTTSSVAVLRVFDGTSAPVGGWTEMQVHAGIAYFLFENPARIERLDLAAESWLPRVNLARTISSMAILSPTSALVAYPGTLATFDLGTGRETVLAAVSNIVRSLKTYEGRAYFLGSESATSQSRVGSLSLANPTAVQWSESFFVGSSPFVIDATHRKALFSSPWLGNTVVALALEPDGFFGRVSQTPQGVDLPLAQKIFLWADDGFLITNVGGVFRTSDLASVGLLGSGVDDLVFPTRDTALLLRGREIIRCGSDFSESSRITLSRAASRIVVQGDHVFAFAPATSSGAGIVWEKRALADAVSPPPVHTVSPATLDYSVDGLAIDRHGILLVYSRLHGAVFRWSISEQRYLQPIALMRRPNVMSYSPVLHRLYLGYPDGQIRKIDLEQGLEEKGFCTTAGAVASLCATDRHLLAHSGDYIAASTKVFDEHGQTTSEYTRISFSRTYTWDSQRRRAYHFQDDSAANALKYTVISETGTVAGSKVSPQYGEVSVLPPIRLSPAADVILLGTGAFFDAETLALTHALPHGHLDAAWLGTRLFTARNTLTGAQIKRWGGSNHAQDAERTLRGRVLGLLVSGADHLVAVTQNDSRVAFTLLDSDLTIPTHFDKEPDLTRVRLANLSTRARVGTADNIMIAGFVVSGTTSKRVLVRAVGPTLRQLGVTGELLDPELSINRMGTNLVSNDDWHLGDRDGLRAAFREAGAFDLPDTSRDAAVLVSLPPGPYTVLVSGKGGTEGIALVETYDLDASPGERHLINISTRGWVGTGDAVMIPGLVIEGSEPKRVLIRAVGPGMSIFGLNGLLADPYLRMVNRAGQTVLTNDDWGRDNPDATAAATAAAGAFGLTAGSKDAAVVTTLEPGVYTVIVSGVGDSTGLALVEVYEVP